MLKIGVRLILLLLLVFYQNVVSAEYKIKGKINKLHVKYFPKIYLATIESINDLYHASHKNVINSAFIGEDGTFQLIGNDLPNDDKIYRLYITEGEKINASITYTDGPNFMFLLLNNRSNVFLRAQDSVASFNDISLQGSILNQQLKNLSDQIYQWRKLIIQAEFVSEAKKTYSVQFYNKQLLRYADTSNNAFLSLFALKNIYTDQPESFFTEHRLIYNKVKNQLSRKTDFSSFSREFDLELKIYKLKLDEFVLSSSAKKLMIASFVSILLLVGLCSLLLYKIAVIKKKGRNEEPEKKVQPENQSNRLVLLTRKEKEILTLLLNDLSNKEIAEKLFVELSTVKTHINNIYLKLGVRNRSELKALDLTGLDPFIANSTRD